MDSKKTLLSVDNLSIAAGGFSLLAGISFDLQRGAGLQVSGPNGVGKTLLMKAVVGLHPVSKGNVFLPENTPFHYIGVEMPFDDHLSVADNFRYLGRFQNISVDPQVLLNVWGVRPFLHVPFQDLSWGQKQRANLTLLFLKPAALWILDEPFQHLDAYYKKVLKGVLEAHIQEGGSVLIAEHDGTFGWPHLPLQNFLAAA